MGADAAADGAKGSGGSPLAEAEPKELPKGHAQGLRDGRDQQQVVFQHFYGNVSAERATFGFGAGAGAASRITGRLDETEITKIVRAYAQPACYEEAFGALRDERVIILAGHTGSGRRAGAIAMLHRLRSPGKPLVSLSPAMTLEQLAERTFEEGFGYLIGDMFDENLVGDLADYHWRSVCSTIRRSKVHLVVTTSADSRMARSAVIRRVSWQRPAAAEALRAHLGAAAIDDEVVKRVAETLGPHYLMSSIETIARRIATSDDIEDVLGDLDDVDCLAVVKWLDEADAQIPAVIEVAALAFVLGVPERVFEAELRHLKALIPELVPETNTDSEKVKAEIDLRFRQLRKFRNEHPLLTVRQMPVAGGSGTLAVRHVEFTETMYRQHLITELWNRLDTEFWDAIRKWLHHIAADGDLDLINYIAVGLALLALVAPDEVIDSYLDPWTSGDATGQELTSAVYVIWQMSMHSELASLALQIAILWAGQGTRQQRGAATLAFSGELGARFPTEAVKRITQLAKQRETLAGEAYALLFATLAGQGTDGAVILREMRRRLETEKDRRSGDLICDAIVDLLSIRDPRSGRPSVAMFLIANPLRTADVAPLWARVLCLRPWRGGAIKALCDTLGAIEHGLTEPGDLVRALGAAIGRDLPPDERTNLRPDLRSVAGDNDEADDAEDQPSVDRSKPTRRSISESLLDIFLVACASPPPSRKDGLIRD